MQVLSGSNNAGPIDSLLKGGERRGIGFCYQRQRHQRGSPTQSSMRCETAEPAIGLSPWPFDTLRTKSAEKLKGNLKEFFSIRINDQWRVIFQWIDGDAYEVRVVDYH